MKLLKQIGSFYRSNKVLIFILVLGLIFTILGQVLLAPESKVIPPYITLFKLLGLICLSVSLFMTGSTTKKYLISNIALILVLIISFELVCFLLLGLPEKEIKDFSLTDLPPEHVGSQIGSVPYKDSVYVDLKMNGTDTVFNVNYTIDSNHTRVTPGFNEVKDKYALFFGCSIAFGLGLEDNQTLPYHFQNESEYNAYNFGYTGYGTNQMLARLQYQNLRPYVKGKDGIAVYVFFWDHIERAIGSMSRYVGWVSNAPYYFLEDGKLKRDRHFKDGRPLTSGLYERLYQSSIVKYFDVGFPIGLNEDHFDLVTEMIKESKTAYEKQFGNDEFYVAIYPSFMEVDPEKYKSFLSHLDSKKIKYIDLTKDFKYSDEHTLGGDPHPNSNTNKELSKQLLEQIEKMQ